jgi:hypothetical protein
MDHWWEIDLPDANAPVLVRAVAYYRHSAQDRQENSIPIQQDQVRAWANQHGVEIIREFCDAGRSGLNSEDRPAFTEMMANAAKRAMRFTNKSAAMCPKQWPIPISWSSTRS